jgi:uncharacterized protein (TIGR03663 family)
MARTDLSPRTFVSAALYILAAALLLRFYDLPLKPLHHDEGVNTVFVSTLLRAPDSYRYNPTNFHGATLFYAAWLSTFVFGTTTVALRVVTAVAGFATVVLLLTTRQRIGSAGALTAAALLALSPGAVYFSRYFIHESLLVLFTAAAALGVVVRLESGRRVAVLVAAAAAALMFATKETAIISAGVMVIAAAATAALLEWRAAGRAVRPTVTRLTGRITRVRLTKNQWQRGLLTAVAATVVFLGVALVFFTSFFTNPDGAADALRTFAFWTRTGTSDHRHAWSTYLRWLAAEELPILVLGSVGAALAIWRSEDRFAIFAALWGVGTIAAYSLIPYKTPWLTLNMIVPLALAAGYAGQWIWEHTPAAPTRMLALAAAVVLAFSGYQAFVLNFVHYDDNRYPYVYAHTDREVLRLVEHVRRLKAANPAMTIAVTSREHFPLSWYLRDQRAGYYGKVAATNDPLVIGSEDQQIVLDLLIGNRYAKVGTYRLRPGVRLVLYAHTDLKRVDPGSSAP